MTEYSGYVLELLREEGDFLLYRGRERGTPILALAVAADQPSSEAVRRLEHEWTLATDLNAAWAAKPLALTRHQGRSVLILSDPGGEPLDRLIRRNTKHPLDLTAFLRAAIGLTEAAGEIHRNSLIHKDIKPANALVDGSGHAWLTGFGIASRVPRERLPPVPPEIIAGTLPYMSPEQTGRMNRSVDSRSDLYSLGVTLYELLTGSLPFTGSDPMEWVHCHVARQPLAPRERTGSIPLAVSSIIMKLLAKTAEERYQTALGLQRDLRRCLNEWEARGRIDEFPPGEYDTPDTLLIPEKLYGRASEVGLLLASFSRVVSGGRPELVLVSGYSGVGKSSVVNELHKPLVPPRGLFASGKFDQYKSNIPYATVAQAFRSLTRRILAKNEVELGRWGDAIREALDPNGQLMVDLVPELTLVIGEQPSVPELSPLDAQRRFHLVFRRFINVFTREHPLAIFLDDLQWLDAATLDLMEDLLTHPDVQHLMLVGAYRDNEVTPSHPLMRKLDAIRRTDAIVNDIVLAPLTGDDMEDLIGDSLHCERERAAPLARLIEQKTSGNPFFAIQFLSALAEDSLLTFDYAEGRWLWDLHRICAKGHTDNVVDLMVGKLNRLPAETQKALQQLACLGNSADFTMLRLVYPDASETMHGQLWEAVRAGLIFRADDSYRFLHDRVQEAAYSMIPQELRAAAHLRIGTLMDSHTPPDKLDEGVFEIVNQLNRGTDLLRSVVDRERVAQFNLAAGRRAKISTAYASALNYLSVGRGLLTDETWESNYELIFSIEYLLAECELLTADMAAAENRLCMLSKRASSPHDIALVARLRVTLYDILDRSDRAVEVFIGYQKGRGENWSSHPTDDEVVQEYNRIWSLIGGRQIGELVELPLVTDPDVLDVLDVFSEVVMSAQFTDEKLLALVLCRMVNLSLEHGNSDASCFAYVSLGMLAGPHFGHYETGFELGKLGCDLAEKGGLHRYRARTFLRFGHCVMPWKQHVKAGRDVIRRAFDAANRIGDLTFSAYGRSNLITNLFATGDPLTEVQREAETALQFAEKVRFGRVIYQIGTQLALVQTLRGLTTTFGSFNDARFDEVQFERQLSQNRLLALPECRYWIRKLQARFFAGNYAAAMQASLKAEPLLWTSQCFFEVAEYHFYSALARSAAFDSFTAESRQEHLAAIVSHHKQLAIWADQCPENFQNRAALLAAEIDRIEGHILDAERLYDSAIRSAHLNGFIHNEALASEVAGRFYAARGLDKIARAYLRDARRGYLDWGADGKVTQLEQLYPQIRADQRAQDSTSTIVAATGLLDLATVIKVSQALSGEIILPKLIEKLVRIAVENAGAQRGLLILLRGGPRGDEPRIEAEAMSEVGEIVVAVRQSTITPSELPQSALRYVIRTKERVLLDDASTDVVYSEDEYVRRKGSRSVLCLPIIKQAKLIGALYLENDLAPYVFTADRVAVLQLLASQAAISLENAALYADLQRSEAFLAQGQKISQTGTFGWSVSSGEFFWSDENYNILGYNRSVQPSAELALERMHPDDRDAVRRLLNEAMKHGKDFDSEHRMMMPDGRIKHVHTTGRAVTAGNLDFVGAVRDITERARAEEALRQALTDLARINRVTTLGELAASIAHEVNQPITATIAYANAGLRWLNCDEPNLDEVRAALGEVVKDGHRAAEIIGRIRTHFEKGRLSREPLSVSEIVRETVGLLRGEAMRHGVFVRMEIGTDLPQVSGDRVQLQQVLMNLIVNSIEAMRHVDGVREMVVSVQRTNTQQILVSVSDTGIGVPIQLAQQIFDPFFTTKSHGTGMGLRISRSIVESHGGCLWIADLPRQGATFHFTLPSVVGEQDH